MGKSGGFPSGMSNSERVSLKGADIRIKVSHKDDLS